MTEMKKAVECGYWHLYRFDPRRKDAGENPFMLDSKEPDLGKFRDFIMGEVRYNALTRQNPEMAQELFAKCASDAQDRWETYRKLAE